MELKGLDVSALYGQLGEKKWEANLFDLHSWAKEISEADKAVIRKLNRVGDGELSGVGIMFCFYEVCKAQNAEMNFSTFYEVIFYLANTIVYEEYRHGLILKELNCAIDGKESFLKNAPAEEIARDYLEVCSVWNDPFEALVSFLTGEVTNIILYREAARAVDNPILKEIFMNISKDEYRHKTAFRAISKKIVESSEDNRMKYIAAYRRAHCIHQAEVGRYYAKGFEDTLGMFGARAGEEIFRDKITLLKEIVGEDIGFDPQELLDSQMSHMSQVLAR